MSYHDAAVYHDKAVHHDKAVLFTAALQSNFEQNHNMVRENVHKIPDRFFQSNCALAVDSVPYTCVYMFLNER